MPAIIYQKDPSALIPQGNRTVSTFPSGLVRVDQSFIGRTDLSATHRSQLVVGAAFPGDQQPSYDGLRIFPEVQEKRLPDKFTEYLVSAFGRTTASVRDEVSTDFSYNSATKQASDRSILTRRYVVANGEAYGRTISVDPVYRTYYLDNPEANVIGTDFSGSILSPFPNSEIWGSFYFSFNKYGTSVIRFERFNGDLIREFTTGDGVRQTVLVSSTGDIGVKYRLISGSISNISATKFNTLPAPTNLKAEWLSESREFNNYGEFTEVIFKYRAGAYY